jgi:hypothetical protein
MIQIRTPVEDVLIRYGIQTYRNEMCVVLEKQQHHHPGVFIGRETIKGMRAYWQCPSCGHKPRDLRVPHTMPYRISFRCVTREERMRHTVFNRQPDLFDSTRIPSVSLTSETELKLLQLLRQLFTELIDPQPVIATMEVNREQDHH